jgi:hypothetical protein
LLQFLPRAGPVALLPPEAGSREVGIFFFPKLDICESVEEILKLNTVLVLFFEKVFSDSLPLQSKRGAGEELTRLPVLGIPAAGRSGGVGQQKMAFSRPYG